MDTFLVKCKTCDRTERMGFGFVTKIECNKCGSENLIAIYPENTSLNCFCLVCSQSFVWKNKEVRTPHFKPNSLVECRSKFATFELMREDKENDTPKKRQRGSNVSKKKNG